MKTFIRVVMGLVALAAGALSFQSLMHLGELCGYGSLSWAYPVTLDLGAAASCASWIHERNRQALGMTWGMLGISVVLNGTLHYLQAEGTSPSWLLVVLVAAVPPIVFGLVVHLAVGNTSGDRHLSPEPVEVERDVLVERVSERITLARQAGEPTPGRRKLAAELGTTEHQVRTALAATNGHGGELR